MIQNKHYISELRLVLAATRGFFAGLSERFLLCVFVAPLHRFGVCEIVCTLSRTCMTRAQITSSLHLMRLRDGARCQRSRRSVGIAIETGRALIARN